MKMKKIISAAAFIPLGIELRNPKKLTGVALPSVFSPIIMLSVEMCLSICW
jgi:hypothetical protein